jgi:hypothetical protein
MRSSVPTARRGRWTGPAGHFSVWLTGASAKGAAGIGEGTWGRSRHMLRILRCAKDRSARVCTRRRCPRSPARASFSRLGRPRWYPCPSLAPSDITLWSSSALSMPSATMVKPACFTERAERVHQRLFHRGGVHISDDHRVELELLRGCREDAVQAGEAHAHIVDREPDPPLGQRTEGQVYRPHLGLQPQSDVRRLQAATAYGQYDTLVFPGFGGVPAFIRPGRLSLHRQRWLAISRRSHCGPVPRRRRTRRWAHR